MCAWLRWGLHSRTPFFLTSSATAIWLNKRIPLSHCESLRTPPFPNSSLLQKDGARNIFTEHSAKEQEEQKSDPPPSDEAVDSAYLGDDEEVAWARFSAKFAEARSSLAAIQWSSLGDRITDRIVPEWVQALPDYVAKLQGEMDMGQGSLSEEIWHEAQDPSFYPEIACNAKVRIGDSLCPEETEFVQLRKKSTTRALARYLNIPERDVDPQDVPTIAICGSGGGLRALVAGASSYLSAQEAGLLDCATYTAGVSGSCWLQTLYHSGVGAHDYGSIIKHLKKRIGTHIAYPPAFLELMTRSPTNKYLLSGTVEKLKGDPKADFGLVDVYGLLLGTRLMVPRDELGVDQEDLKLSSQRKYLRDGAYPMPIYTAVRHEIPIEEEKAQGKSPEKAKQKAKERAWFQWVEFSPYEMWCETFGAGIPTWSIGRHFDNGRTRTRDNGFGLPELRIPFLMGMWGSAFCATLAHYYKEVRPLAIGLAGFGGIDELMSEKNDEMARLHPIDPGAIPNYALGLQDRLPKSVPKSVFKDKYLELMDAGMSNNLPIYPLLRKARDVDIIVCFDASADIEKENWIAVVDDYAKQHKVKGWPMGSGWPHRSKEQARVAKRINAADAVTAQLADEKLDEPKPEEQPSSQFSFTQNQAVTDELDTSDLGYCNIWVGTNSPGPSAGHRIHFSPPPSSSSSSSSSREYSPSLTHLRASDAGMTLIYFPLLPNPSKVPGIDPATSPYLSTWNFIYTPEQIDNVVRLAKANLEEGKEATREAVRAVYERKKAARLKLEEEEKEQRGKMGLGQSGATEEEERKRWREKMNKEWM